LFGCALADALDMRTIVIPPHAGVLSALGLAAAPERVDVVASFHRDAASLDPAALRIGFASLLDDAARQLPGGALRRVADCRYAGQGYEVRVVADDDDPHSLVRAFHAAHQERYGYASPGLTVEVINLRVVAERPAGSVRFTANGGAPPHAARREVVIRGSRVAAHAWPLDELRAGQVIAGPAVLAGRDATALIEPGWRGEVHASGALVVRRT
jgi:N-methylhydantoinase A